MRVDASTLPVINNHPAKRFEVKVDDQIAILTYRTRKDAMTLLHTEVPEELAGQGIASRMASTALDYAREHGLSVIPMCPYVRSYIQKHPEYQDLVDSRYRG